MKEEQSVSAADFYARFAKNSVFYFLSQIVGKGLFFFITVYLARVLGASDYGKFAFAYGLVTLLSVVTKFGLDLLTSRDVGESPQLAARYFHASLTLRIALSIVFFFLILLAVVLLGKSEEVNRLIFFLALAASLQSIAGAGTSLFEGLQSFGYRAVLNVCTFGFILLAVYTSTRLNPSIEEIGPAFVIGAALYLLVTLVLGHIKIAPVRVSTEFPFLWQLFRMAVPLGLTEIFIGIYYRADTVMLSLFHTDAVVGWYDAAYTFVYVLRLVPVTAALVLLPALTALYSRSEEKAVQIYQTILFYSIAIGFLITFIITINSHVFVPLVYGSEYNPAADVLMILIWTCVIMFANAFQGIFLIITHQRIAFFRATAMGAVSNVILNLLLIPRWSMHGAAIATVLSELIVFLFSAYSLRGSINLKQYRSILFLPVSGTLIMILLWYFVGVRNFWLGNMACVVAYILIFAARRFHFPSSRTT